MTKVDETAVVPPVDAVARERLARALDRDGVVAASLFGSQAGERSGPLSDVDVGVWLDPDLAPEIRFDWVLELSNAAAEALRTGEVDLVVLNDAPPLLRQRVVRDGERLVDRDPRTRIALETAAILEYLDTAPLRETFARARRAAIAEGTFGRP